MVTVNKADFRIKTLDFQEYIDFVDWAQDDNVSNADVYERLATLTVVDHSGSPLFDKEKPSSVLNPEDLAELALHCQRINGMGSSDEADTAKN